MRKIIVLSMITLDGVLQAPGAKEEDTEGGFRYGGWMAPYGDEKYMKVVKEELKPADYLLGRKTYELWSGYWPYHADFWPGINKGMKYVLSRKLKKNDPMVTGWKNSAVVRNTADIKKIKKTKGRNLHVWGSSELIHLLLKHDLVDELRLKIHPVILGKGKKLFDDGSVPAAFHLTKTIVTKTGVIIAYYSRGGKIKRGSVEV